MFKRIIAILKVPVVKQKIFFTFLILLFFRFITSFTIPGVNKDVLTQIFNSSELLQVVNLMSGGLFLTLSVLSVGLGPYITASYIFQILAFAFPTIKELYQGGPIERKLLTKYMRWVTFPIALLQAGGFLVGLNRITTSLGLDPILEFHGGLHMVAVLLTLVFGAYVAMWFGELITQFGLGGGSSVIIMIGILAGYPMTFSSIWGFLTLNWQRLLVVLFLMVLVVLSIIVTLAVRKIHVVYAQRVRSSALMNTQNEIFIPINPGGVMPVIFAVALLSVFTSFVRYGGAFVQGHPYIMAVWSVLNQWFSNPYIYNGLLFTFTMLFAYFSTFLVLNPEQMAENLQKQGAFIKGVRPGKETEMFIRSVTKKVVLIGGVILGGITVLPSMARFFLGSSFLNMVGLGVSGTGILIVVAVIIDIIRQLKSVESTLVNVRRYF